jgi:acyl carrier protein
VSAKMKELKEHIQRQRDERDAKDAEKAAERAEDYAADSLDFAAWAIEQAQFDVLDAVDARAVADAEAAETSS